jgi:GT2 family glycosyltransferase
MQNVCYDTLSEGSLRGHGGKDGPSRFSGTLILVRKSTWKTIGGFKQDGFLGIDDDFRSRLHKHDIQFAIMDGVYLYHWYRADAPYETSSPLLERVRKMYADFIKDNEFDLNKIVLLCDDV